MSKKNPIRPPKAAKTVKAAPPVEPPWVADASPAAPEPGETGAVGTLRTLAERIGGARLCYGEPVQAEGRTVVTVARVRAAGGAGWGRSEADGDGGGGGGALDALPVGFIEIGADGARYHRIEDPEATLRLLRAGAASTIAILTTLAGLRAARRRPARRLPRGR